MQQKIIIKQSKCGIVDYRENLHSTSLSKHVEKSEIFLLIRVKTDKVWVFLWFVFGLFGGLGFFVVVY